MLGVYFYVSYNEIKKQKHSLIYDLLKYIWSVKKGVFSLFRMFLVKKQNEGKLILYVVTKCNVGLSSRNIIKQRSHKYIILCGELFNIM